MKLTYMIELKKHEALLTGDKGVVDVTLGKPWKDTGRLVWNFEPDTVQEVAYFALAHYFAKRTDKKARHFVELWLKRGYEVYTSVDQTSFLNNSKGDKPINITARLVKDDKYKQLLD